MTFSELEKERIRQQLLEVGRELFGKYGLKKTSISELTKAVGIAQGSFYTFYSSKEVLFFDILQDEEGRIREQLMTYLHGAVTRDSLKRFFLAALDIVQSNRIVRRLFVSDDYAVMMRKLPDERVEAHIQRDEDILRPIIQAWQEQGVIVKRSPESISALLRMYFMLTLHQQEIGEDVFADSMDLLADCLAAGLIGDDKDGHH